MTEAPAKSAAQLRADKRNAKIRAGAGSRIASITTSARGEEGSAYLNKPTPFETRQAPAAAGLDPDDIDLSSLAPSTSPRNDPFRASLNPELSGEGGQDLMSMLASMSGSTNASGMPELPPELANNPLMAALSQMGGAGGTMPQGMPQMGQMGEAKPKSLLERSLPLLHFVSMVGLVVWAVLRGEGVTWSRLPFVGESNKEWAAEAMGIVRPVPLFYAFITAQLVLQTLQIFVAKRSPPPPSMLQSIIPMIPHPFGMYVSTGMKYYALFGSVLDDLSVLLVGIGCCIIWQSL